jgi:hypothetical protein
LISSSKLREFVEFISPADDEKFAEAPLSANLESVLSANAIVEFFTGKLEQPVRSISMSAATIQQAVDLAFSFLALFE